MTMSISKPGIASLVCLFFIFLGPTAAACSMYKLSADGKTIVGCNEDAWRTTSRIWFKNGDETHLYGAAFTGSRIVTDGRCAPQSGMNEVGLVFSRLTAYHPIEEKDLSDKIAIAHEVDYLAGILQTCRSVAEVKAYIKKYDHSIFIDDVFIYIDSTGDYLIVEPHELTLGNDPNYVLSNFCPSITQNANARNLQRFRNGEDFIELHEPRASLAYATALSDTMHVCRNRNGDGTLLTSIWDTQNGSVNLFFYHDFEQSIRFNLEEELAQGDHFLSIPELFPANAKFERLVEYTTPFNTPILRIGLALTGGLLMLVSLFHFMSYFLRKRSNSINGLKLFYSVLNIFVVAFLFVLATEINIYYFNAPYQHYSCALISASAYVPFLLLIALVPLTVYTARFMKLPKGSAWSKGFLLFNGGTYLVLTVCFFCWGFYSIFS
ncbi:MAG: hypothetical protein ACJAQ4_002148 [Cryomorphaceae bacterium]|jgi:hypothetical protein